MFFVDISLFTLTSLCHKSIENVKRCLSRHFTTGVGIYSALFIYYTILFHISQTYTLAYSLLLFIFSQEILTTETELSDLVLTPLFEQIGEKLKVESGSLNRNRPSHESRNGRE